MITQLLHQRTLWKSGLVCFVLAANLLLGSAAHAQAGSSVGHETLWRRDHQLPPSQPCAQGDCSELEKLGQLVFGDAGAVATDGVHTFVAVGSTVYVFDAGEDEPIGQCSASSCVRRLTVAGTRVYAAAGGLGLRVPVLGVVDQIAPSYGVALSGSSAYVATGWQGLRIVDISNPEEPLEIGTYITPSNTYDVAASGDYAYVATYSDGLRVIDMSAPEQPVEVGFADRISISKKVELAGDHAIVAGGWGFHVVNVMNPENPHITGRGDAACFGYDVAVSGNYVYVVGYNCFDIFTIDDPENPRKLGSFDLARGGDAVAVAGGTAYVAERTSGLLVMDVSDPANPRQIGVCETLTRTRDMTVSGGLLYLVDDCAGLSIMRADPTAIEGEKSPPPRRQNALGWVYPNPFNPRTSIPFTLEEEAHVRLAAYDLGGALVRTLLNEGRPAGAHNFVWNGKGDAGETMPSGVYVLRLEAGSAVDTRRVVLLK